MAYSRPELPPDRGNDNDDPMIVALRRLLAETDQFLRAAERVRRARAELGHLLTDTPRTERGAD